MRDEPDKHSVVFLDLVVLDFTHRVIQPSWLDQHARTEDTP